jgi:BirA family biotin operon repressor/biotin-[acetyl-CoA-carboxylase] ligase
MLVMNVSLSQDRIAEAAHASPVAIEVVACTGSTNADLLARIDQLAGPVLLVAHTQTAGRGRAGRNWHAAPDASLTFSLAWPFRQPLHALVGLPLAVGVALAEALAAQGAAVNLKWPNDVLHGGLKVGGILIETATAKDACGDTVNWAVIGVGLNLALPDDLAQQIDRPAAALSSLVALDRNSLMATLLNRLAQALRQFEEAGFAAFMARWNRLHAHAGQAIDIVDHGKIVQQGVAIGVDAIGRLLLDTAAGQVAVMAGDVSLRPRGER